MTKENTALAETPGLLIAGTGPTGEQRSSATPGVSGRWLLVLGGVLPQGQGPFFLRGAGLPFLVPPPDRNPVNCGVWGSAPVAAMMPW